MKQHEITATRMLLDAFGNVAEPGYAKRPIPIYRRSDIKAGKSRIKEWDYYFIGNGRTGVALTVADNGYMGLDSVTFFNFGEGWEKTVSPMSFLPMGKRKMPESSASGDVVSRGKKYSISFVHEGKNRVLSFRLEDFMDGRPIHGRIVLSDEPEESMVISTPFKTPGHFYFNQKINCMRAEGYVTVSGKTYEFEPETAFAVLDWGRGVWTYHNTWYWGSASGVLDGVAFGWNIGYGFGDTSAATENMLFYGGKAHKLGEVVFNIPQENGEYDYMNRWTFTSDDGKFEMVFTPILDRASCTDLKLIKSDQHQVFGRFTGTAVLDDGTKLDIKDFFGFAEHVENKW
ncbi:MAG: DUF2804 domain-containing protein [Clostridia bacterium]|nr:DUF2804 domain-containing protein [Clostridia bacterium]